MAGNLQCRTVTTVTRTMQRRSAGTALMALAAAVCAACTSTAGAPPAVQTTPAPAPSPSAAAPTVSDILGLLGAEQQVRADQYIRLADVWKTAPAGGTPPAYQSLLAAVTATSTPAPPGATVTAVDTTLADGRTGGAATIDVGTETVCAVFADTPDLHADLTPGRCPGDPANLGILLGQLSTGAYTTDGALGVQVDQWLGVPTLPPNLAPAVLPTDSAATNLQPAPGPITAPASPG